MVKFIEFIRILHKNDFVSYEDCRKFVKTLNLKIKEDWSNYCRLNNKPSNIPIDPYICYQGKGWVSWGHFLGVNDLEYSIRNREFLEYDEAKKLVRTLGLKTVKEYRKISSEIKYKLKIPSVPENFYKTRVSWQGWCDYLGTGFAFISRNEKILDYEEAKNVVGSLGIKTVKEYTALTRAIKCELKIPCSPQQYYKTRGTWLSWYDFLGKQK